MASEYGELKLYLIFFAAKVSKNFTNDNSPFFLEFSLMFKLSIFGIFMLLSFSSKADCPVADQLILEYGISFSGFKTSPPRSNGPQVKSDDNAVLIKLPNKKGLVPDGFFHSAVISTVGKRAWLHRVGGFPSVDEWYGPVEVKKMNLTGCNLEKYFEAKRQ